MSASFIKTTNQAGIDSSLLRGFQGTAISLSWVDVNTDGYPDIWISPHGYWAHIKPALFLNSRNGTFQFVEGALINGNASGEVILMVTLGLILITMENQIYWFPQVL